MNIKQLHILGQTKDPKEEFKKPSRPVDQGKQENQSYEYSSNSVGLQDTAKGHLFIQQTSKECSLCSRLLLGAEGTVGSRMLQSLMLLPEAHILMGGWQTKHKHTN